MADDQIPVFVQGMREVNPDSDGMVYFPANTSPDEIQRQIRTQLIPQLWKQNPQAMFQAHTTGTQQRNFARSEESMKDPGFSGTLGRAIGAVPEVLGSAAEKALEPGFNPVAPAIEYGKNYWRGFKKLQKQSEEEREQGYKDIAHGDVRKGLGELSSSFGHWMGRYMPSTTEAAEEVSESAFHGRPGQAAAEATMMFAPYAADLTLSGASRLGGRVLGTSRYSPQKAADIAEFESRMAEGKPPGAKPGAQLTYGQRTGNRLVRNIERRIERTSPFAAPAQQTEEVVKEGQRQAGLTAQRVSPTSIATGGTVDLARAESGRGLEQGIDNYHAFNKAKADLGYSEIRQILHNNPETRTIGIQRATPAQVRAGMPPFTIIQDVFEGPVPMKPIWGNRELRQLWTKLNSASWATREGTSPGWTALNDLMHPEVDPRTGWPKPYKNAMDLDTDLGHLKRLVREASRKQYIDRPSRAILLKVIGKMEDTLEPSLNRVQPGLYGKLQASRRYVQRYSKAEEVKNSVMGAPGRGRAQEPAKLHAELTTPGDSKIETAKMIRAMAPAEVRRTGRMELEYLAQKWINPATGEVANAGLAYNELMRLGPETRSLLFGGAKNAREVEALFRTMAGFFPSVGSATMDNLAAVSMAGATVRWGWEIASQMFQGDVSSAIKTTLGGLGTAAGLYALTRFLFRPGNAGLFMRAITAGSGPALREAMRQLGDRAMLQAEQDRRAGDEDAPDDQSSEMSMLPAGAAQPQPAPARAAIGPRAPLGAGLTPAMKDAMIKAGEANNVPPSMLMAMAQSESGGNVAALSPKGAQGLMQFMPETAREWNVNTSDPTSSIEKAAALMGKLLRLYNGDQRLALAAYNAGPGAVARYRGVPPFPETKLYVEMVLARMGR